MMVIRNLLLLFALLFAGTASAQILDPVDWEFKSEKIGDSEYELIFIATMDEYWAVYSQYIDEGGPIPTGFSFEESDAFTLIDSVIESEENRVTKHDPVFDMMLSKFYDKAVFTQKIKLLKEEAVVLGELYYMTCDDEKCLAPTDVPFEFRISLSGESTGYEVVENQVLDNGDETNRLLYGMVPAEMQNVESTIEKKSMWIIFGLGFLGGLLALLTPCVFPMIPLTVSFFAKNDNTNQNSGISKAVLYGFFIVAVYVVLSAPFHLLDTVNPDILNEVSTNVWLNIIFFLVFLFFAFSFFGYYELTLPSSWTARTTQGENIGGIFGVFFMALTLALVSFSCTGPILGSLLAGSLTQDGGAWQLTAGMGGFGLALGLPFAVFAAFPGWLNALPKSGGWLNTVKVVLGFLELALALKFLSNADLVMHWGILKIEVFLGLWILIFAGLTIYLLGKIKFPHDAPVLKLSFTRVSFAVLFGAFTIYLATGFRINKETNTFTSLTLLSGLAPPVGYSFFFPNDSPNDLNTFKDFREGINHAMKVNKPVMLDFTGHACVNCRKMEEHVWPDERIDNYLRNEYVIISLYVDDKKELPLNQQVDVNRINGGTRTLKNYGHKWANFQTQFFQINSQPYYVLLTPDGKRVLNEPVAYTPDKSVYAQWLESGLEIFKARNESARATFSVEN